MNDDSETKLDELFAAARTVAPDTTRVEFGFETRLLARLRAERAAAPPWFFWAWRLTPVFAALVLALGVWTVAGGATGSADLRATLVGEADQLRLLDILTGD